MDGYTRVIKADGASYGVDQISAVLLFSQAQILKAAAGLLSGLVLHSGCALIPATAECQIIALCMSLVTVFTQTAVILTRSFLWSAGHRLCYMAVFTSIVLERGQFFPLAAVGYCGKAARRKLTAGNFCCSSLVDAPSCIRDSSFDE